MAYVIGWVKRIQHDEGVVERPLTWVLGKFYAIAIQVELMGLEAATVEMEEAGEVPTQRLRFVRVKAFKIG